MGFPGYALSGAKSIGYMLGAEIHLSGEFNNILFRIRRYIIVSFDLGDMGV